MSFFEKVAIFSGFLLFYAVFIVATVGIQKRLSGSSASGAKVPLSVAQPSYFSSSITSLLAMVMTFGSIWILSGFFDVLLFVVFVLVGQLTIVLQYALGAVLTPPNLAWTASRSFFFHEAREKHPIAFGLYGLSVVSSGLLVPLLFGLVYFANDVPSDYATKQIFKVVFGWSLLSGMLLLILPNIMYLCSRNVDQHSRLRVASGQFAGIGSTALSFSVLFWSLELSGQTNSSFFASDMLSISPLLLTVLLLYFFCCLIGPYLVGSRQAAMWQDDLLQKQQSAVGRLVEILRYPTPISYELKLDVVAGKIRDDIARSIGDDKFITWIVGQRASADGGPDHRDAIRSSINKYRELDPRLQHIDCLEEILGSVREVAAELARIESEDQKIRRAAEFSGAYKQKADEEFERESLRRRMAVSFAPAMTFVVGAALTAVIGKVGEVAVLRAFTLG